MAQALLPESILVADCGAVATKVGLIDRVEDGTYRLIGVTRAMTTVEPPTSDISVGVTRALAEMEDLMGRRLLSDDDKLLTPERADGAGVDAFVAVTSAALPLRAAIVGLSRDFSVASAQRALASTYAVVDHTLAVDEESGRWGTTARDGRAGGPSVTVENLALAQLDLIVMVGGVDGGALTPLLELANIVAAMGAAMDETKRPLVLFAGNRAARALVAERIGSIMRIVSVENVRPELDRENVAPLQNEIANIFYERKLKELPGLDKLNAWSAQPVIPTAQAWGHVAQYLARKYALRVLAVDWGGATTTLTRADSGQVTQAMAPDYGLGYGLTQLLDRIGIEGIARWLPPSVDVSDAHANLLNQALRPWTTSQRKEDFISLHAAGREALTLGAAPLLDHDGANEAAADLVLLAGAPIARGSKPGALMLMVLDALQLRGIFSIAGDVTGIAAGLGAVAAINPDAAAQVVETDALVTWGTAFVPTISSRAGEGIALELRVQQAGGGRLQAEVKTGSLELIPLPLDEKAQIEVRPARGVDLGVPLKGGVFKRELQGGTVGLIVDARGRPLPRLENLERQRERVQEWMWEMGA